MVVVDLRLNKLESKQYSSVELWRGLPLQHNIDIQCQKALAAVVEAQELDLDTYLQRIDEGLAQLEKGLAL